MTFRFSPRTTACALLLAAAAAAGCNGSASMPVDSGPAVKPGGSGNADVAPPRDTQSAEVRLVDAMILPPAPMPNAMSKIVAASRARLIGSLDDVCNNQVPYDGDRWCAFTLPDRVIGKTDLWVANVTKVSAGTPIKCDGSDPNCMLMTEDLWTAQPMGNVPKHPTIHRFDGNTLIFHAKAPADVTEYKGPIFAWRPGWAAPKQISGNSAFNCSAHFLAEVYVCVENLTDPAVTPFQFDLTAGKLSDGVPHTVGRITPSRAGTMSSQWRANINRAGDTLIWSTGGPTTAETENLYTVKFDDLAAVDTKKAMVGVGIARWQISADSAKFYYFKNYNYPGQGSDPNGTLAMSDYPTGANEVVLAANVAAFGSLTTGNNVDAGVGFFDGLKAGTATYKIIKDRTMPMAVTTVVANVPGILGLSRDLRFLVYNKQDDPDTGLTDGYIVKTDGSGTGCMLTTNTSILVNAFGAAFTPNASMVMWVDNVDVNDGVADGWVANPDGCTGKKKWGDRVDFWFFHENDGMVFSDTAAGEASELKYVTFPGGNSIGTPVSIQKQIARIFGISVDEGNVLYNIAGSMPAQDGLFTYRTPFSGVAAPATDGGTGQ